MGKNWLFLGILMIFTSHLSLADSDCNFIVANEKIQEVLENYQYESANIGRNIYHEIDYAFLETALKNREAVLTGNDAVYSFRFDSNFAYDLGFGCQYFKIRFYCPSENITFNVKKCSRKQRKEFEKLSSNDR
ncbi:MAG: hypothetical protein H6621_12790 [Halobacteriovoraceae bacterium]|nr:hypothetical protein [Halobacteriovoraceae bacterium]MCB9095938.1 hypothetical protein [Halobacteriovoraceae bacterium]